MDKNAFDGTEPSAHMSKKKDAHTRGRAVRWVCLLILALALLFAVWMIAGIAGEDYRVWQETLDVPIPLLPLTVHAADAFLQENFPETCGNKTLTEATISLRIRDGAVAEGTMRLTYDRYLHPWAEGGAVETQTYTIDTVARKVVSGTRFRGSGKAAATCSEPIADTVAAFPVEWYVAHARECIPADSSAAFCLHCHTTVWGMDVSFRARDETGAVLYAERLSGWDAEGGFSARQYRRTDG